MLNNESITHELGTVPVFDAGISEKDKNREAFERGDKKQDRHTGKSSPSAGGTHQAERVVKSMGVEEERADEKRFTKELIAQGLVEWKNRRNGNDSHPESGLKEAPSFDWRKVWEKIQDTSWDDAVKLYEIDMSIDAYEEVQREIEKRNKELEKEARREREIRNFSITGDPKGDKNRTSLVQ